MLFKKHRNWIVVADGTEARIYYQDGGSGKLMLVEERRSETADIPTHELVSDRQGRTYESATPGRHSIEARHDPHAMEKEKFLRVVADLINAASLEDKFNGLILCAAPHALGELRKHLSKHAQELIKTELAKDLMHVPVHDLPAQLAASHK